MNMPTSYTGSNDPQSLRLSPYYSLIKTESQVSFIAEEQQYIFDGKEYVNAINHFISSGNKNEPCARRELPAINSNVVDEMANCGVLQTPTEYSGPRMAYWDSLQTRPVPADVAALHLDAQCADLLAHALKTNSLSINKSAEFLVVVTNDYLRPEISQLAERTKPWILAKPVGHTIWLGPLIIPGKTACWRCMAHALSRHRWMQAAILDAASEQHLPQPSTAALPATIATAVGMLSTAIAVYLARGCYPELENTILSLDTRTMRYSYHLIRHRRNCESCGQLQTTTSQAPLRDLVSHITGIVTNLELTSRPAGGIFHAWAEFVHPISLKKVRHPLKPLQAFGKGYSELEAQNGCIAEAVERYSLTFQGTEILQRARFQEVDGISPDKLLLFSDTQYRNRGIWNTQHGEAQWVPERLPADAEINWTLARSFASDREKFVPAGFCYMHYPFKDEPTYCSPDTNGCAAGRTIADAMLNALLELVERDAVAIWWYNRLHRPRVELESFNDMKLLEVKSAFEKEGHELYLLDITTDTEVPAYAAIAPAKDGARPYFGCAAHTSARTAALKAVAELSQIWFWSQRGTIESDLTKWIHSASLSKHEYLRSFGTAVAMPSRLMRTEEALEFCVKQILSIGIEPFYVDLTRPETGVPVIRAIAPGLRHFWARLASGRLYEIPVCNGWLSVQNKEEELNPVPCML